MLNMEEKILLNDVDNIQLILNGLCKVKSLESGAKLYGGATRYKGEIYSNFYKDDYIYINKDLNILSLFIPSTVDINKPINNSKYVIKYFNQLYNLFYGTNNEIHYALGSYYSKELKSVIFEDVAIITFYFCYKIDKEIIKDFIDIALKVREEMTQECVSLGINGALCII